MWSSTFLDESGRPSFNALKNYASSTGPLIYYAFDVLILAGKDVMSEPLTARRELLEKRVLSKLADPIRQSPTWTAACAI
jgi:bifunctional non-homologous end joining protein LigD